MPEPTRRRVHLALSTLESSGNVCELTVTWTAALPNRPCQLLIRSALYSTVAALEQRLLPMLVAAGAWHHGDELQLMVDGMPVAADHGLLADSFSAQILALREEAARALREDADKAAAEHAERARAIERLRRERAAAGPERRPVAAAELEAAKTAARHERTVMLDRERAHAAELAEERRRLERARNAERDALLRQERAAQAEHRRAVREANSARRRAVAAAMLPPAGSAIDADAPAKVYVAFEPIGAGAGLALRLFTVAREPQAPGQLRLPEPYAGGDGGGGGVPGAADVAAPVEYGGAAPAPPGRSSALHARLEAAFSLFAADDGLVRAVDLELVLKALDCHLSEPKLAELLELLRRKLLGDGPGPPMRASHLVSFETVAELLIGYV